MIAIYAPIRKLMITCGVRKALMRSPPPLTTGFYPQAKTAGRPRSGQSRSDTLYSDTDASKTLIEAAAVRGTSMAGQDAHRGRCTPYRRHSARLVIRGTAARLRLPRNLEPAAGTQRAAYERARRLPGPCSGLLSRKGRAVKDVPQTRRRASARFPVARKCVRIKYPPTGQAPSPFASPSGRVARPRRGGPTSGAPFLLPIDLP